MTFDEAVGGILKREGDVFTNDATDFPTKYGVTLATYRGFKPDATVDTIRQLTADQARAFYFWYLAPFMHLAVSEKVWTNLLDAVTLHGQAGAIRAVQRVVGVAVDGIMGPATTNSLTWMPEKAFLVGFAKARMDIMTDDIRRDVTVHFGTSAVESTDLKYLRGWLHRVVDVAFT